MVLYIDKNIVENIPKNLAEFTNHYPLLYNRSKNFTLLPVETVDPLFSLYIGQGEFAVVPNCDKVLKIIGSDEATTCHNIIIKDSFDNVAVAHFDGNCHENGYLQNMVSELQEFNGNAEESLDVFVVGGYHSESGEILRNSESLSLKILEYLCNMKAKFNLELWCTVDLNTKIIEGTPFPLFYGIAFDRERRKVFPANFSNPAPNIILRSASMWVEGSSISPKTNLYDYKNHIVTILPFRNWNKKNFKFYSTLPNPILLKYFSTSPLVEPPLFCQKLRKVFSLLGTYCEEEIFPDNKPIIYKINKNGKWYQI